MAKQDVVAAGVAAIQSGEVQVYSDQLGIAYDVGASDQKASDGTFQQSDIDAAVKAAVDPLNAQIAQDQADLAAAHADADSKLAALQSQLDALSVAKAADDEVVKGLQQAADSLQSALDAIKAVIFPAPQP